MFKVKDLGTSRESSLKAGLRAIQSNSCVVIVHRHRCNMPDIVAVFANRAVTGEFAAAGDVEDRHFGPSLRVVPRLVDFALSAEIVGVIGKEHVFVVAQKRVDDRAEQGRVAIGEVSTGNLVDHLVQFGIALIFAPGVIAFNAAAFDLLGGEAEEEEVFGADFLADFDVGRHRGCRW